MVSGSRRRKAKINAGPASDEAIISAFPSLSVEEYCVRNLPFSAKCAQATKIGSKPKIRAAIVVMVALYKGDDLERIAFTNFVTSKVLSGGSTSVVPYEQF